MKEQIKESDRQMKEQMKESDRQMKEQMKETDQRIKELTTRFISQSGHIIEGLMEPAAMRIFKQAGFDIDKCWKEMKGTNKAIGRRMEVDLFYHDTTESVAVEVKTRCTCADVDHFLQQMQYFKAIFPEFSKSIVYAAIAAINYDRDSDVYASQKGLFVIRVSDNSVFTLDPADKNDMVCF